MKNNNTKLNLVIIFLLAVMSVSGAFYFGNIIKKMVSEADQKLSKATVVVKDSGDASSIKKNIEKIKESSVVLKDAFVSRDNPAIFIDFLENLGSAQGLETKTENFEYKSDANEILITLKTNGTWDKNMKMLNLLENVPQKIFIQNLNININGSSLSGKNIWTFVYNIKAITN